MALAFHRSPVNQMRNYNVRTFRHNYYAIIIIIQSNLRVLFDVYGRVCSIIYSNIVEVICLNIGLITCTIGLTKVYSQDATIYAYIKCVQQV